MKRWTNLLVLALLLLAGCDEQVDKPVQPTPHRPDLEPADAQDAGLDFTDPIREGDPGAR